MEPDPADVADVDAHHERETAWRSSLLLGSFLAALIAAFSAVGPVLPRTGVASGVLGHAGDATALFTLCSVFVGASLMAQWPIDDRLRRLPIPLWLFALVRGASLAVLAGVIVAAIASVAGLWQSVPQYFATGAVAGGCIGAIGAIVGALVERSRRARIVASIVVFVALAAGIVTFVLWRFL